MKALGYSQCRNQQRLDEYRAKRAQRDISACALLMMRKHGLEVAYLAGRELPTMLRKQAE